MNVLFVGDTTGSFKTSAAGFVILRYSEGSGSSRAKARSFGVPQDDSISLLEVLKPLLASFPLRPPIDCNRSVTTLRTYNRGKRAEFVKQMQAALKFDVVTEMIGYKPAYAHSLVEALAGRTDHLIFASTVDIYEKPYRYYPVTEDHPRGGVNG